MKKRNLNETITGRGEITARLYWRLLPVLVLSCMVISANSFIDSMFAGRCLGTQAMAVTGLFGPISTVLSGIASIMAIGAQQLCCTEMGNGNSKNVSRIFNTGALLLVGCGILMTVILLIFRGPLAVGLGAAGEIKTELSVYITGISIGIVGQLLSSYLMPFLQINGKNNISYCAMIANLAGNLLFNILFVVVLQWGLLGLGLATSFSGLLCTCLMLPIFKRKEELAHFELIKIQPGDLVGILKIGSPVLMFQAGLFIKNYGMNRALLSGSTVEAVAVLTLQGSICGILGALPYGSGTAVQMLASFFIGEGDSDSIKKVLQTALKTGYMLCIPVLLLLIIFARPVILLFGIENSETQIMAVRMIFALSIGIILNMLSTIFVKMFQAAEKLILVNGITFVENAIQGVFTLVFVGVLGADAAWFAFPIGCLISILVIFIYGFLGMADGRRDLLCFLHFPKEFGVAKEQKMTLTIHSMEDVMEASHKISDFCTTHGMTGRIAMVAGLCVEEMAGNVVEHGFKENGKGRIWILVLFKDGKLIIRIRDNCIRFDPKEYLQISSSDDSLDHVGIRLVTSMTKSTSYQNVFGMNMLTVEV